jgi:hypothetical protein
MAWFSRSFNSFPVSHRIRPHRLRDCRCCDRAWGSGPRGEAPEYTGMDVIIVRDGKIAALYVFLDSIPS